MRPLVGPGLAPVVGHADRLSPDGQIRPGFAASGTAGLVTALDDAGLATSTPAQPDGPRSEAAPMSCRFCNSPTPHRRNTCAMCLRLIRSGAWHLLADFWLTYRPQDWTDDVAAFLEITEGFGAQPTRAQPPSSAALES
jgi:hypothetical protein